MRWSDNDALFFEQLKAGRVWEEHVADVFRAWGHAVDLPPLVIRDDISDVPDFASQVDLRIYGYPIEVKSRSEKFTDPESFPFVNIFVDTVKGFNAKDPKPAAYICVSQQTGALIGLPMETRPEWGQTRAFDKTRRITDSFYVCDWGLWKTEAQIKRMLERLRQRQPSSEAR